MAETRVVKSVVVDGILNPVPDTTPLIKFDGVNIEATDLSNRHNEAYAAVICDSGDLFDDVFNVAVSNSPAEYKVEIQIKSEMHPELWERSRNILTFNKQSKSWAIKSYSMPILRGERELGFCDPVGGINNILAGFACFADKNDQGATGLWRNLVADLRANAAYIVAHATLYSKRVDCSVPPPDYQAFQDYDPEAMNLFGTGKSEKTEKPQK